jgi:hypothetical protein
MDASSPSTRTLTFIDSSVPTCCGPSDEEESCISGVINYDARTEERAGGGGALGEEWRGWDNSILQVVHAAISPALEARMDIPGRKRDDIRPLREERPQRM